MSRVIKKTIHLLHKRHKGILYFQRALAKKRLPEYAAAIHAQGAPLTTCWAFIDGTKHPVARPSARDQLDGLHENLQRSIYSNVFEADPDDAFRHYHLYGDPAYGCNEWMTCPFSLAQPGSPEQMFNRDMSSVRESVEWSFGRLKTLWPTCAYAAKNKIRHFAVGKMWLVAALLTNCHTCMQPRGNQISMYFNLMPPTVHDYLYTI